MGIGVGLVGCVNYKLGVWLEIEFGKSNLILFVDILEVKIGLFVSLGNDVVCVIMVEK